MHRRQLGDFMLHREVGEVRRMRASRTLLLTVFFQLFPRIFPNRFQHAVARISRDWPGFPDQQAGVDQPGEAFFDRGQQA
jgi:hypothetical protein